MGLKGVDLARYRYNYLLKYGQAPPELETDPIKIKEKLRAQRKDTIYRRGVFKDFDVEAETPELPEKKTDLDAIQLDLQSTNSPRFG